MPSVRAVRCPQCGSAIDIHQVRSRHVGCPACGAQLDLKDDDPTVKELGKPWVGARPLALGKRGKLRGVEYEVVAHVAYTEQSWGWHEFLLLSDAGGQAWLQLDEGRWTAYTPFTPEDPQPVEANSRRLKAKEIDEAVIESGAGSISHIAGELTWQAKIGDSVSYLDSVHHAVEIGPREIEWFRRSAVNADDLQSFGVARPGAGALLAGGGVLVLFLGLGGVLALLMCISTIVSAVVCNSLEHDADGDCAEPAAFGGRDCDDADPKRGPYANEVAGDGVDQDCDGKDLCYVDRDGDGVGGAEQPLLLGKTCASVGFVARGGDCNDSDRFRQSGCYDDDDDGFGGGHYSGGGGFGGGK